MKKCRFILFAFGALFVSCTPKDWLGEQNPGFFSTRSEEIAVDYESLDTVFFVTMKDVANYIHFRKLQAKDKGAEIEECEVTPMGLDDGITLCYFINYYEGWEIISADKRFPVV